MDPLNPFAALDDMASAACDAAFGIAATLLPQAARGTYGVGTADPDRPPINVVLILSSAPSVEGVGGQGTSRMGGPTKVAGQTIVAGITAFTLRNLPYQLRADDHVRLLNVSAPYPSLYRIARFAPNDMGDLELILNDANED